MLYEAGSRRTALIVLRNKPPQQQAPLAEVPRAEYMDGCQNYGPLLRPLNSRCRTIARTQKGTVILTTSQMLYMPMEPHVRAVQVASRQLPRLVLSSMKPVRQF